MQKVTNLGRFVCNRLPFAQSVPLCAVRRGRGLVAVGGAPAGGAEGRGPPGDPPECDSGWSEQCLLVVCLVGAGASLHILSGVLVGVVAWFQRFPGTGGVRGRDECATRASLHIYPGSWPRVVRRIRVIPPFTDRGL